MSSPPTESGVDLDLNEIRKRLKREHDRRGRWDDVGDLFGITGYWASLIARGEKEPGKDLRDRMERVLTEPMDTTTATTSREREKLARWLEWIANGVRKGMLPIFDFDADAGDLQGELQPERPPGGADPLDDMEGEGAT